MRQVVFAKDSEIRALGQKGLDRRMRELRGDERNEQVEFLRHLDEFDKLRGWQLYGLTSLWQYCEVELGLPAGAIYRRTHAMTVMRAYPRVIEMLRDGRLSMTTLNLLEEVLTPENASRLFRDASRKATRYVEEEIVAPLRSPIVPREDIRELRKKLAPIGASAAEIRRAEVEADGGSVAAARAAVSPEVEKAVEQRLEEMTAVFNEEAGLNRTKAVSRDQFQVDMTVSRAWMDLFRRLANRLGGVAPNRTIQEVTFYAMEELAKRLAKRDGSEPVRKYTLEKAPKPGARRLSAEDERFVRERDGNRCQWVKPDGTKCLSAVDPEIDHGDEFACGGATDRDNCQVLCRAHNQQKAREKFGEEFIERKMAERRANQATDSHHQTGKKEAKIVPAPEVGDDSTRSPPDQKGRPPASAA